MKFMQRIVLCSSAHLPAIRRVRSRQARTQGCLLYFVWPQNGAVIKGGFWCRFGLRNMGVTHAGDSYPNSGHHHLLST
jgi:hypothetical protein